MEASSSSVSATTVTLEPMQEFRFELEKGCTLTLVLISGAAEICGWELRLGVPYHFSTCIKTALFTFQGCQVKVSSQRGVTANSSNPEDVEPASDYVANEAPLPNYLALHLALERKRILADANMPEDRPSVRVLIVGEKESGKSTLAKTLVNWTIRSARARSELGSNTDNDEGEGQSRGCLFVNLDPSAGAVTIPTTLSVAPIYLPVPTATPVHSLGHTNVSGLAALLHESPEPNPVQLVPPVNAQVFSLGATEWSAKPQELQSVLLNRIGATAQRALVKDDGLFKGGMVVDTPSEWSERKHSDKIKMAVRAFEINVLVVLGSEKLMVEMTRLMNTIPSVTVLRAPKSGGVVDLDAPYRKMLSEQQIHSYFYGGPAYSVPSLSPHSYSISFDILKVYRLVAQFQAPQSALPIGADQSVETELEEIDPMEPGVSAQLNNAIAWLSQADDKAGDLEKLSSPVLGFIHIAEVDIKTRKYTILSPSGGRLPRTRVIVGELHWLPK